jgi:putative membrane protein
MEILERLPPTLAALNLGSLTLLLAGFVAIRGGHRERHRKLMLANLGLAAGFLALYLTQVALVGHQRFEGEGGLRTFFLTLLASHTILAVSLLGLVPRTLYLALRTRFADHKRIARITFAIWLYVSVTGVIVYTMLHHVSTGPTPA